MSNKLFGLFVFVVLLPSLAQAAGICNRLAGGESVTEFRELGDFELPAIASTEGMVSKLVKKYSKKAFEGSDFLAAVDQVYQAILKSESLSPVEKADKMGRFGLELNAVFEADIARFPVRGTRARANLVAWNKRKAALDRVKRMKFVIAMSVENFENFVPTEYKRVKKEDFVMTRGNVQAEQTHMTLDEYPKYVESYLDSVMDAKMGKKRLFNSIDSGSLGVLGIGDIRDITSYNLWPMYLKEHDMRHVHYGLSHPLALAVMMRATRSKVPLRYTMLGGLYEGVDRVQYSQETAINEFFAQDLTRSDVMPEIKRDMDLEEAMITLAYVPKAILDAICDKVNYGSNFQSFAEDLENWRPKVVSGTTLKGYAMTNAGREIRAGNIDLEEDAKQMVFDFMHLSENSEVLKAEIKANPDKKLTKTQKMLLWMMNYQLNPASPEVVIEGMPYKNDGRAHYSGNVDSDPLGLGDQ